MLWKSAYCSSGQPCAALLPLAGSTLLHGVLSARLGSAHYKLHTTHCTKHTALCTLHRTLHTPNFTLCTKHCTLYNNECTIYTAHCILHGMMLNLHCTLYTAQSKHYKLHIRNSTLHYVTNFFLFTRPEARDCSLVSCNVTCTHIVHFRQEVRIYRAHTCLAF